jgi:hypothetical protein
MPLDFYYTITSPPCRSVLLLAKTLGLELNLKKLDLLNREHHTPEFLKVSGTCKHAHYFYFVTLSAKRLGYGLRNRRMCVQFPLGRGHTKKSGNCNATAMSEVNRQFQAGNWFPD